MIVELAYDRGQLPVRLPDYAQPTVIRKRALTPLRAPAAAVRDALENPLGAPALSELARGRHSACILICDITRPVPNGLFLRPMIEALLAGGMARQRITVLVATGLHRPNEGPELQELVGDPWVLANVAVLNHFARNDGDHLDLGLSGRGTPVKLDRRFMETELKIATGLVEAHFMAGYSGGRKVVVPGICHAETIRVLHSARFMEDPQARQCVLEDNPLNQEQLEIVGRLGPVYALNTVLDENRALCLVNFGEVVKSHLAAVEFVRGSIEVPVARRFRTVVTSAAGYPLDKTYYQTVKGMVTPLSILEPGGRLIVASACSEGLGSADFKASQARLVQLGPARFLESIADKRLADIDEWETEMQLRSMRVGRVSLYSGGLNAEERRLTAVEMVDSVEEAVARSLAESGDPAVAIIPEGPYVVPLRAD